MRLKEWEVVKVRIVRRINKRSGWNGMKMIIDHDGKWVNIFLGSYFWLFIIIKVLLTFFGSLILINS